MGMQRYKVIVEDIRNKINQQVYIHGDKLPTEMELKEIYSTSQSTVRTALKQLSDEGYIYSIHRVGNFINIPNKNKYILYFDEVEQMTGIDQSEILSIEYLDRSVIPIEDLIIKKNALEVRSLFKSSGIPVAYDIKYIAYNKGITTQTKEAAYKKLFDILSKDIILYNIEKEIIITGVRADGNTAKNLRLKQDENVLKVEYFYFDKFKKIIAYNVTFYRPSFIKLHASIE